MMLDKSEVHIIKKLIIIMTMYYDIRLLPRYKLIFIR